MWESSVQAFLGSFESKDVTLCAYGPGGLAGAMTFPLSSNTGGGVIICFILKKIHSNIYKVVFSQITYDNLAFVGIDIRQIAQA